MAFPDYVTGTPGWEKVTTSSQKNALGTQMVIRDKLFRYVENAATEIGEGLLVSQKEGVPHHSSGRAVAATAAAGATSVSVTILGTAAEKNLYKDGYIFNNTAAGTAALMYRVASHDAISSSGTGTIYLDEPNGLVNAWTAGTDVVGLIPSPWKDVVVYPTTATGYAVGVSCNTIEASYYGWVQTRGPCLAMIDTASTTGVGTALMAPTDHVGQMELLTYAAEDFPVLATVGSLIAVDNEWAVVFLRIE